MERDARRISDLYHAVLQRPVHDRSAFLSAACNGDAELQAEVESLLRHESASERFLEGGAVNAAARILGNIAGGPPMVGRQLGPYTIVAPLGSGGMGEVYRARDSQLRRDVAIKILPEHFYVDEERRARFAREARLLATLNHPHIGAIYGFEEADGVTALVLELVEGPTLAACIERGRLPVPQALAVARDVADALEAAHQKNIIHRDLKPSNIVLQGWATESKSFSGEPRAKVIDFGLGRAIALEGENHPPLDPATTLGETADGRILGSPSYMSPEQARGDAVDKRTDVWAFGCVLFEMLTGRRAFERATVPDTLAAVLEHEPEWAALPIATPDAIRRLLRRSLEKEAARRLRDIGDARLEIEEAAREPTPGLEAPGARRRSRWRPIVWAATGAGIALLVTMMPVGRAGPTSLPGPLLVTSIFVDGVEPAYYPGVNVALAPSGRTVVFAGNYGARTILYRRDLDRLDPEPIVGTECGSDVFFSHDGRWLGFEKSSELWIAPVDGGTPQRLLPNQPLRGGTWGPGDRIVLARFGSGLWIASTTGGEPRQLTYPKQGERHELPQLLPGGRAVLFTILSIDKPPRVAVHLIETGETRTLFEGEGARFVASGHVVFGRQERLWAVGFNPDFLQMLGEARPVRDDVLWSQGYPQFTTDAGLLAYLPQRQASRNIGHWALTWRDRHGVKSAVPVEPNNFGLPRWSPRGDRFVVQFGASRDLWTYDLRQGQIAKLTSDRIVASSAPVWTPNGSRVVFTTWFDGEVGLGWLPSDGSGPVQELIKGVGMRSFERTHPVMLPDGSGVIMTGLAPGATVEDLLFVPLTGERRLEVVFQAPGVERNPAIAPSGRFIAYNSDESGGPEVYVRPFPNAGSRKSQISTEGGSGPVWTRDGSEIIYRDLQGRMMAVAVRIDDKGEFVHFTPKELFKVSPDCGLGLDRSWDVTADGERFLFRETASVADGKETDLEIVLLQNWTEELKRLVPREPR